MTFTEIIAWIKNTAYPSIQEVKSKLDTLDIDQLNITVDGKVDKVTGKALSANDYTTEDKSKLDSLENYTHPTKHPASIIDGKGNEGKVFKVDGAGVGGFDDVSWNEVQGKPSTFTPSAHEHDYSPSIHTHDNRYYTEAEMNSIVDELISKINAKENKDSGKYALLDSNGKIVAGQLGDISVLNIYEASSEANMLALSMVGMSDLCIRSDLDTANTFICKQTPATDINNWVRLNMTTAVSKVNGKTGVVVLDKYDIGLGNVDNTADMDKPVSTAVSTALDTKADKSTIDALKDGSTKTIKNLDDAISAIDASAIATALSTKADQSVVDTLKGGSTKTIKALDDGLAAILATLNSPDINLDTFNEIVTVIKADEELLPALTSGKVNVTDIVNALTSTDTAKPLSAAQGKVLKDALDSLTTTVNNNAVPTAFPTAVLAATAKTIPADADVFGYINSVGWGLVKFTWANFKSLFKTIGGNSIFGSGDIAISSTPTTAQVLSAMAGASLGAVGTHAFLCQTSLNTTAISAGGTYAGSVLRYSGFFGSAMTTASTIAGDLSAGSSPAGTWMALGSATYTSANESRATLFLRIA